MDRFLASQVRSTSAFSDFTPRFNPRKLSHERSKLSLELYSNDLLSSQPSNVNFVSERSTIANCSNSTTTVIWESSGFRVKLELISVLCVFIWDCYWELEVTCKNSDE